MKRFALEKLIEWKDKQNRKPLIIRGARQVGKTWLMKEFGRTCFEKVAYVNFDNNKRLEQVFEGDINIDRILLAISIETGVSIDAKNTLLIFDEVQEVLLKHNMADDAVMISRVGLPDEQVFVGLDNMPKDKKLNYLSTILAKRKDR